MMPIKMVAKLLDVGWDLVKEIHKAHLKKRLKKKKWGKLRYLAVDEFAVQKGHRYMTVVLNLETGEILHAADGKNAQALIPFLKMLKSKKVDIKAIAIDMGHPYRHAIEQVFDDTVDIVHDPYHVVSLVNKAIDDVRRDLYRDKHGREKRVLKGSRFVLLKGLENLSPTGMDHLIDLMALNHPLYEAYLLKEELRLFWNLDDRKSGEGFLSSWLQQARQTGIRQFLKLAKTLERHRNGLLAYFSHRISTGPLEGLNNKIKVLKRQAYGFRDKEYFKLRLFFIHEDALAG